MPDDKPKKTKIIIPRDGISTGAQQPRAVYDPISQRILSAIGPVTSQRASHVDAGKDMSQAALKVLAHKDGDDDVVCAYRAVADQPYQIVPQYAEHWFADMTLCGHDVVLGPYDPADRNKALADEVAWLHEHNIPVCMPCIEKQQEGVCVIGEPQKPIIESMLMDDQTGEIQLERGPIEVITDPMQIPLHPLSLKSDITRSVMRMFPGASAVTGQTPNESNTGKTGVPGIDQSGLPPGEIYAIGGTGNTRFSSSEPARQSLPVRTLPAPKWLNVAAEPNIAHVDATKLLAGLPHVDVGYSGIEDRLLSHYRREVADAFRTRILSGQDDVEGANGWEEAGDVLSCTVFRVDHSSTEQNPPSVSWTLSVTFVRRQCSVADFSFGRG